MPAATLPADLQDRYANVNGIPMPNGVPKVKTPTLAFRGEADQFLGKELTHGTEQFVENLRIRPLPETSHRVQQEALNQVPLDHLLEPASRGG